MLWCEVSEFKHDKLWEEGLVILQRKRTDYWSFRRKMKMRFSL